MNQTVKSAFSSARPRANLQPTQAATPGLKILLLEDVAADAALIERELRRAELAFTARCVFSRDDFIHELEERRPDIILSDFSMPSFNAIEALEILREREERLPFILVTGSQSEEVAVECMKEGADDYILKETLRRLPSAVVNAVQKHAAEREKRRAEAEIEKLAAFPRVNPNPIFELTSRGTLTYCNRAAEELARAAEMRPEEILPEDTRQIIRECLRTGRSELQRETNVNNRVIAWSFFPVRETDTVHCYATDITDRVQLEAQLRQSQKLDSIGQLAAGIAHDFNNILTIIRGYSQMLLEDDLQSHVREPLEQVAAATERATNLTRQLLMFSRKQVMQPQLLDLNDIIASITKMLRRILGEDIRVHFHYSPHLPAILADSSMIEQIILNLAVNARDAMPRGGNLTIGTNTIEITRQHARYNSEAVPGCYVCLRVSDNGTGIPPEILPRIFEPFFTTKGVGKGAGLGLATIYGIAKQHHGWVEALTEVGKGTTFRVFLPVSEGCVKAGAKGGEATENCHGTETILVVEDEPELRQMVCEILRQCGYTTLSAGSGPEAAPIWQAHAGRVDLLLTDMVMPGNMSGKELAEQLRAQNPRLKVIYTSGYSVELMATELGMHRGLNFLQKPYHPRTLLKVVRDCLDS